MRAAPISSSLRRSDPEPKSWPTATSMFTARCAAGLSPVPAAMPRRESFAAGSRRSSSASPDIISSAIKSRRSTGVYRCRSRSSMIGCPSSEIDAHDWLGTFAGGGDRLRIGRMGFAGEEGEVCLAKVIVLTSGKGGVGKTTSAAAIAAGPALRGKRTAVIDFDVGLRNLDLIMGCERRVVFDFINVINGDAKLNQALIRDKRNDNLYVFPTSQTRDKEPPRA